MEIGACATAEDVARISADPLPIVPRVGREWTLLMYSGTYLLLLPPTPTAVLSVL